MKLIVLNLPRDLSEDELAKLFKNFGDIKACDLVMDAKTLKSKGFAFVQIASEHEGNFAIQELHSSRLRKEKIRVKHAV